MAWLSRFERRQKIQGLLHALAQLLALLMQMRQALELTFTQCLELALQLLVFLTEGLVLLPDGLESFHRAVDLVFQVGEPFQAHGLPSSLRLCHINLSEFGVVARAKKGEDIIADGLNLVNRLRLPTVEKNKTEGHADFPCRDTIAFVYVQEIDRGQLRNPQPEDSPPDFAVRNLARENDREIPLRRGVLGQGFIFHWLENLPAESFKIYFGKEDGLLQLVLFGEVRMQRAQHTGAFPPYDQGRAVGRVQPGRAGRRNDLGLLAPHAAEQRGDSPFQMKEVIGRLCVAPVPARESSAPDDSERVPLQRPALRV